LNTQKFRKEDQQKIIEKLKDLGLKARMNRDKKYYRVRFFSSSIPKLKEIIGGFLVPSMYYKLSYNPVET